MRRLDGKILVRNMMHHDMADGWVGVFWVGNKNLARDVNSDLGIWGEVGRGIIYYRAVFLYD